MKSSMSEQEWVERLDELPREISPVRDPWPKIIARIEAAPRESVIRVGRRNWIPIAAAAMLVIVAGLVLGPLRTGGPGPALDSVDSPQTGGSVAAAALALRSALAASESQYRAAFREFIPVEDSLGNLPPATVETIQSGWNELHSTETVLTAALEQHPNDLFLNERMFELRERQLGFLKQLARLDRSNRRMTI